MAYAHIYEIPDQGSMRGGDFYDRYGNLTYFADVTSLVDKTQSGADKAITVKSHNRSLFMNSATKVSVAATGYTVSVGLRQSKGAVPGYTVTLTEEGGLTKEVRQFQYTGTMSALVAWLKTTAKMLITLHGPSGTPYDPIPAASP